MTLSKYQESDILFLYLCYTFNLYLSVFCVKSHLILLLFSIPIKRVMNIISLTGPWAI